MGYNRCSNLFARRYNTSWRLGIMDSAELTTWASDNLPQLILLIGGLLAVCIAITYVKNKDSMKYKALMLLGLLFGVFMAVEAVTSYGDWMQVTSIFVAIAAFTLIIRPFRDVHIAAIIGLLVMVIAYIWLGGLTEVSGCDISFLAENPVRVIVAFLIGAVVYGLLNFAESIVKIFGKLFNWWPFLFIIGCICIAEAVFMFMGYGSITDYFDLGGGV